MRFHKCFSTHNTNRQCNMASTLYKQKSWWEKGRMTGPNPDPWPLTAEERRRMELPTDTNDFCNFSRNGWIYQRERGRWAAGWLTSPCWSESLWYFSSVFCVSYGFSWTWNSNSKSNCLSLLREAKLAADEGLDETGIMIFNTYQMASQTWTYMHEWSENLSTETRESTVLHYTQINTFHFSAVDQKNM